MLIEHNYSVREPLLESLEQLDRKDFTRSLGKGKSSIRNILVHLMNSEIYWMNVIGDEDRVTFRDGFPEVVSLSRC